MNYFKFLKHNTLIVLTIGLLSGINMNISYADCLVQSFKENYLKNINEKELFFVKGIALDVFEYGRIIKVIEDLKGNFIGNSSIFVWGDGHPSDNTISCMIRERCDFINEYQENDTLIMLVRSVDIEDCIENIGDYTTIACAKSVLLLSDGLVTGYIHAWGEYMTMSWENLQEELLSALTSNQFLETKDAIYQRNGVVFFDNSESVVAKLSFYDLSGRLVHEAQTTSNNYRPVLTGNILICRININNKTHIIKYIVQ